MKTLDEVINALTLCTDWDADCQGCPYRDDNKGGLECVMRNLEEVLHYLKEYQDLREILPDHLIGYFGHRPVVKIDDFFFAIRCYDRDHHAWRCDRVEESSITHDWVCTDDDTYVIDNKGMILYREVGWDMRKEPYKREDVGK